MKFMKGNHSWYLKRRPELSFREEQDRKAERDNFIETFIVIMVIMAFVAMMVL